jgi:hypothetical protein
MQPIEKKAMNNKFDKLAKGLAQSVTRRQALKRFGVGLAGIALACFGLANRAQAACLPSFFRCQSDNDCCSGRCVPAHTKYSKEKLCY